LSAAPKLEQFEPSQRSIAEIRVLSALSESVPVYNLSVADGYLPEYYANGILTHNCQMTAGGYEGDGSPDRVDAMVWGFTELFPAINRAKAKPRERERAPVSWMG
jgi:hypothetical protein